MASHRLNPHYTIKESSTCGSLYTKECCSIGSLKDKILVPEPDSSPHCAKCGTPVDGPYCRGCALLRKKFKEDLITYCVENGIFQDCQDTSEISDDNTNVVNAPREPIVVNQDPVKSLRKNLHKLTIIVVMSADSVDYQEALDKILKELEELKRDQRMLKELKKRITEEQTAKENMSIKEMTHEQQLVDRKIKEIMNDLGYKRFRGEKIDEEYERDYEIRIRKLKQDFNEWGSKVRKKEQAYEEEKYSAACRYMLSITCDDEVDFIPLGDIIACYSIAITPDLPIEEFENSLIMGDEPLSTIPATELNEVIKSSVKNLVPIPSEFEGMFDDMSNVPTCDNNCVNVESDLVESLINRDSSIVHSSKIDPILEEFAGKLAHIALILPGIVEADPDDDTSSDDDDFEDIEYVSFEEVNDFEQEEKEFDLEDILQIQDVILREKLLNISHLITNIESLKDNPTPIPVTDSDSSDTFLSHSDNSLPEFESFSDDMEETRSGSTTTHANYSLPEYESFHFDNPSFSRPPPEPPDVEICLHFEPDAPVIDNFNELNDDQEGGEIDFSQNVEDDDSFTFVIRTFLPFLTYPEVSPLSCSTGSEDTIFDPGIST
ncbi:hypothetical protein Tco_0845998 [Tanacetum coccineum]